MESIDTQLTLLEQRNAMLREKLENMTRLLIERADEERLSRKINQIDLIFNCITLAALIQISCSDARGVSLIALTASSAWNVFKSLRKF